MPSTYKVYVTLGFHTSFHHSWRGDTPDEAGFGTDIRVVRQILRILDEAGRSGQQARGYWDLDVYWTLQEILPHHAPDIVAGIRQRVAAGLDEIVLGYFNNGANHAATRRELRAALSYAVENPAGSGLRQVFGQVSSLLRPQECMYTAGQNAIFLEEGISGLVLYYAAVPFNALSTFIPALPPQQRYNPLWLRARPDEPPILLWPCISPGDLLEEVSLEALLLKLRRLQTSGQVRSDLLVHINFDADGETWLPAPLPRAFAWFPNSGGLAEYIRAVNRYPWAAFTVPSEYLRDHAPQGEVLVRQDLADGGFDGNYSWAEKCSSLLNWTALEGSRLHTYRAEALARRLPGPLADEIRRRLWAGQDAPFQRLIGLTTTHFGMSTPLINEERQAKAERLLGSARLRAAEVERDAALALRAQADPGQDDALYLFEVFRPVVDGHEAAGPLRTVVRLPVVLPPGAAQVRLEEAQREPVAASLLHVRPLLDGGLGGELLFHGEFGPAGSRVYRLRAAGLDLDHPPRDGLGTLPLRLQNRWLDLRLSADTGIASLSFEGQEIGGGRFLAPFITYRCGRRPRRWTPAGYTPAALEGERWAGLARARLRTRIAMDTPHGPAASHLQYTFTLFDDLPYLLVDVEVEYASTPPQDLIHSLQQKLRRLLDLRWIEVAPCQLQPEIKAPADHPLRVWKHNYLGVTSYYDLDYGRINPRNRELDSFNHQVTAGWLAVSNGRVGLLLAESAEALASLAFCPMRLRERDGQQRLALNPFGSYHGRQPDHSHLGGNGVGARFTLAVSGALRPNGPSFNGQRLAFSLLLAPYRGDEPPPELQAAALAHFYPPGVVYLKTPPGLHSPEAVPGQGPEAVPGQGPEAVPEQGPEAVPGDAVLPGDLRQWLAADETQQGSAAPLPAPGALLANPSDRAVDLVWETSRDGRLTGHQVRWRQAGEAQWQSQQIPPGNRWQVAGLLNRQPYQFQVRALAGERHSEWSRQVEAAPGAVGVASPASALAAVPPWTLLRMVGHSLAHVIGAGIGRLAGRHR